MLTVQTQCQLTRPFPSLTLVARKARRGSGDMAVPNLFWRNVEVVNALPPLYLNFYRKLAMIAEPLKG